MIYLCIIVYIHVCLITLFEVLASFTRYVFIVPRLYSCETATFNFLLHSVTPKNREQLKRHVLPTQISPSSTRLRSLLQPSMGPFGGGLFGLGRCVVKILDDWLIRPLYIDGVR